MIHVTAPPSKAHTLRAIVLAALGTGSTLIKRPLLGEDQLICLDAIKAIGATYQLDGDELLVEGVAEQPVLQTDRIDCGNSGVTIRLITSVVALAKQGRCVLDGTDRMRVRPIADLATALNTLGADIRYLNRNGVPPIEINCRGLAGGHVTIPGNVSSQFLSSLLIAGATTANGIDITLTTPLVSRPYVDITLGMMAQFGVTVHNENYQRFTVAGGQTYQRDTILIEGDYSSASYFAGAAAVTKQPTRIANLNPESPQADKQILPILQQMGCSIVQDGDGVVIECEQLQGVDVNMANCPDIVPTVGVVAAFAEGQTIIRDVSHLKYKECNRLDAVRDELNKLSIDAHHDGNNLFVSGGEMRPTAIETYDDHRIAMSFALAALTDPAITINDPHVVAKSFPTFFDAIKPFSAL